MHEFETAPDHRMTDEEAQAVLRVLSERQNAREAHRGQPSVHDVAALANAPVEEVHAALAQVRAQFVPIEDVAVARRRNVVLPIVAACTVLMFLLAVSFLFLGSSLRTVEVRPNPPVAVAPQPEKVSNSGLAGN